MKLLSIHQFIPEIGKRDLRFLHYFALVPWMNKTCILWGKQQNACNLMDLIHYFPFFIRYVLGNNMGSCFQCNRSFATANRFS